MKTAQVILVVAAPGNLQAGLQTLMANLRQVEILVAGDEKSTFGAIQRHDPSLVVLDGDVLGNRTRELIRLIQNRWPHLRCLVLANDIEQREHALVSGASEALQKGYPAAKLIAVVKKLLVTGDIAGTKRSV